MWGGLRMLGETLCLQHFWPSVPGGEGSRHRVALQSRGRVGIDAVHMCAPH